MRYSMLIVVSLLVSVSCLNPHSVDSGVEPDLKSVAALVAEKYDQISQISFDLLVLQEVKYRDGRIAPTAEAVTAKVAMTADQVDIKTYKNGQEIPIEDIDGCLIGTATVTWINGDRGEWLAKKISESKYAGTEVVEGHPCRVTFWERVSPEGEEDFLQQHELFVDTDSHFVYQWRSTQAQLSAKTGEVLQRITRTRIYKNVSYQLKGADHDQASSADAGVDGS